jgi:hypothetical protein
MTDRQALGFEVWAEHPEYGVEMDKLGAQPRDLFLEFANLK